MDSPDPANVSDGLSVNPTNVYLQGVSVNTNALPTSVNHSAAATPLHAENENTTNFHPLDQHIQQPITFPPAYVNAGFYMGYPVSTAAEFPNPKPDRWGDGMDTGSCVVAPPSLAIRQQPLEDDDRQKKEDEKKKKKRDCDDGCCDYCMAGSCWCPVDGLCCIGGHHSCCGGHDTCCSGHDTCCRGGDTCCSDGDTCCSDGDTCCSGDDTCCSCGDECCSGGCDCDVGDCGNCVLL